MVENVIDISWFSLIFGNDQTGFSDYVKAFEKVSMRLTLLNRAYCKEKCE